MRRLACRRLLMGLNVGLGAFETALAIAGTGKGQFAATSRNTFTSPNLGLVVPSTHCRISLANRVGSETTGRMRRFQTSPAGIMIVTLLFTRFMLAVTPTPG